ncbi:tetratricopeptide repeat protein [Silvibacterium acidisoli]|uniref:tetratricopeptide repeat protein n=1 Tax=Acidobacteriaceae bacterium ZG23-2 TaxID=2883246 RepID=UPI00406C5CED
MAWRTSARYSKLHAFVASHALGLLLCGSTLAQTTAIAPQDQQAFQRAMAAVDAGDSATAKPLLEQLTGRYSASFEVNEALGLIYASEENLTLALPHLERAAKERPGSDTAAANLGIAYLKTGRNDAAAHTLTRAVALNPSNTGAQGALGQAWMELKQPAKAAAAFESALHGENNPELLYNAALAEFDSNQSAKAADLLGRIPGVEESAEAQSLYGDVDEKLGQYKEAGQHYLNAARLEPNEANEYAVGAEFLRHWTFPAAVAQLEPAARNFPQSRRILMALGIAYFGDHKYDKSAAVFAGLLKQDPENQAYADLLGRNCSVELESEDPTCTALLDFARKHQQNGDAATYAAIYMLHRPDSAAHLDEARELLERGIRLRPESASAYYGLGLVLGMQEKWQQSISALKRAIQIKPDLSTAHYRLAIAYRRTGQADLSREEVLLEQKYRAQESRDRDIKLEQIQTFLLTTQ